MRYWLQDNLEIIIALAVSLGVAAIVVVILLACGVVGDGSFDIVAWTVNPANPASPLHH